MPKANNKPAGISFSCFFVGAGKGGPCRDFIYLLFVGTAHPRCPIIPFYLKGAHSARPLQ